MITHASEIAVRQLDHPIEASQLDREINAGTVTALRFFSAIFDPTDVILIRPIETWKENGEQQSEIFYDSTKHIDLQNDAIGARMALRQLLRMSDRNRSNIFFGVCPRFGGKSQFDLAWQVRTIRALWADLDHISVDEARQKVAAAKLPEPSIVVSSGNGAHLYWLLSDPYIIDDAPDPPAVLTEFIPNPKKPGKFKPVKFIQEGNDKIYLDRYPQLKKLGPKANHVQNVLCGIAMAVGGDHTHDLARLLRVPGSLNRKNQRNGEAPKETTLVECEPARRYSFSDFEKLAKVHPEAARSKKIDAMPLPQIRKPTPKTEDKLADFVAKCSLAEIGTRSDADFALLCYAVEKGIDRNLVWQRVSGIGKFEEGGERYFELTWAAAEHKCRATKYAKLEKEVLASTKKGAKRSTAPPQHIDENGTQAATPTIDDEADFCLGCRDPGTGKWLLSVHQTRPTAVSYVQDHHAHPDGRTLHFYAGGFREWRDNSYPEIESMAINQRLQDWLHYRCLQWDENWDNENFKGFRQFLSNKGTIDSARAAIESLTYIPSNVENRSWIGKAIDGLSARDFIACRSSLYHVPTKKIYPATPSFFATSSLDFDIDLAAPYPKKWHAYLNEVFEGDPESILTLQCLSGYMLSGRTDLQKIALLIGPPRGGKGTYCRMLTRLIGERNVVAPTISGLAGEFGTQSLIGPTLGIIGDAEFSGPKIPIVVERLKSISGEDLITIPRKGIGDFTMRLPIRFIITANRLPQFNDSSRALVSRFVLLKFSKSFLGKENSALEDELIPELSGILLWALEGLDLLRELGKLPTPASGLAELEELSEVASPASAFARECCDLDPEKRVLVDDLFEVWCKWKKQGGWEKSGTKSMFSTDLRSAFTNVTTRQGTGGKRFFQGIDLKAHVRCELEPRFTNATPF